MLFPLVGIAIGAVLGARLAKSRGGNSKDIAQWAAVFAMIFGLIGLFGVLIIDRIVY
ncbi:MAG: C4-dicarboxylate transporter/malic acid transport protein [Rhodobacteraceae bacterium HLUCCA08]|nr:MAG: C4-dicarboxylate transporter/malic acid transport protein [Rhodobacteraceae bacterium HLUCCA08]